MEYLRKDWLRKTPVVWFGALICCALWGSAFPCIKIGYEMFRIPAGSVGSQILFAGYRFTLAGLLVIAAGSILNRRPAVPRKKTWGRIIRLSLLQTVAQYLFFYIGLAHTTGTKASVIEAVNVFVAILVSSLIFRQEKMALSKIIGCAVGFAGVLLVNMTGKGFDMNLSFTGEGFIFLSTIAYAFSSVLIKEYSKTDDPVILSGFQFLTGGIIMIIAGFLAGGKVTGFSVPSSLMLLYLAFISAAAYTIWGILLKYNPISKVAVFGFMNPVFGVILSGLLLGESTQASGYRTLSALALVCVGIWIVNREKRPAGDGNFCESANR